MEEIDIATSIATPGARASDGTVAVWTDGVAISATVLIALAAAGWAAADPYRFTSGDWPTQLLPWYTFLGERLRAGDIPGWNPHQFAGAPFAGDPNSGWAYLPAMILYTALPPAMATVAFVACQLVVSGLATYLLARALGLASGGALVAAVAFMIPWTLLAARQLPFFVSVTMWIPLAMLGAELALRASRPLPRLGGWLLCGLAIGQLLASWIGKGAYYGLLPVGAWLVFRTCLAPARPAPFPRRVATLAIHGAAVLALGCGLGAAGLLPRIDATSRSNITDGSYDDDVAIMQPETAWSADAALLRLAGATNQTRLVVGAGVFTLAALALLLARTWFATPFFAVSTIMPLLLASDERTPLHALLFTLLPMFERIHSHNPAHIVMLVPLPAAMLAGATVSALARSRPRTRSAALAGGAILVTALVLLAGSADNSHARLPLMGMAAVGGIVSASVVVPRRWNAIVAPALAVSIAWQGIAELRRQDLHPDASRWGTLYRAHGDDVSRFLHDNPVAAAIAGAAAGPHRYNGYDPGLLPPPGSTINPYRAAAHETTASWLLVNNWATWFGLDSGQGYNPWQVRRFIELINAMNGHRQEYHGSNLFPGGTDSPLLDLLNVRFLIVPADAPLRDDLRALTAAMPELYAGPHVRVLENRESLPRAWLVHEARQVAPEEALSLLAEGRVDPRQVALLEVAPPSLSTPAGAAAERIAWEDVAPDYLRLRVEAAAPALLVLSEVWDPGWSATVGDEAADVLLANHALRAIPVPAGVHVVELRYEAPWLRAGMAISGGTALLMLAAGIVLASRARRAGAASDRDDRERSADG